ncbi:MAG: exodeoxyribonuclease VII small subunit [Sphaerospermopsis sp. SIO1G2]|nr:exodeoxyribonuclease VII small subunit [Sphaerospermopsis sp. SIO1G2]
MSDTVTQTDNAIDALSFEHAMDELEQIVRRLETGDASLEESLSDYSRGKALQSHCQKRLHEAKLKVEKIMQDEHGAITTEPFDS